MNPIAKIAAALALGLVLSDSRAETRVYGPDADGDTVTLTQEACTLPIEAPVQLMHATLTNGRDSYAGCWAMANDGVRILWQTGAPAKGWRINPSLFRKVVAL